ERIFMKTSFFRATNTLPPRLPPRHPSAQAVTASRLPTGRTDVGSATPDPLRPPTVVVRTWPSSSLAHAAEKGSDGLFRLDENTYQVEIRRVKSAMSSVRSGSQIMRFRWSALLVRGPLR